MDLEGFDTETFYEILLRHSLSVTTRLSQTKEEVSGGAPRASRTGNIRLWKTWSWDMEPK